MKNVVLEHLEGPRLETTDTDCHESIGFGGWYMIKGEAVVNLGQSQS